VAQNNKMEADRQVDREREEKAIEHKKRAEERKRVERAREVTRKSQQQRHRPQQQQQQHHQEQQQQQQQQQHQQHQQQPQQTSSSTSHPFGPAAGDFKPSMAVRAFKPLMPPFCARGCGRRIDAVSATHTGRVFEAGGVCLDQVSCAISAQFRVDKRQPHQQQRQPQQPPSSSSRPVGPVVWAGWDKFKCFHLPPSHPSPALSNSDPATMPGFSDSSSVSEGISPFHALFPPTADEMQSLSSPLPSSSGASPSSDSSPASTSSDSSLSLSYSSSTSGTSASSDSSPPLSFSSPITSKNIPKHPHTSKLDWIENECSRFMHMVADFLIVTETSFNKVIAVTL
jgi:hypothetical protein